MTVLSPGRKEILRYSQRVFCTAGERCDSRICCGRLGGGKVMSRNSGELRVRKTLRNDVLRMAAGVASILVVTAAFTGVVAFSSDVLGA